MVTGEDFQRDAGWSWVVLLASMTTCYLEMGTFRCFGIYMNAYLDEFNTSVTVVSLISGVFPITFCIAVLPVTVFGTERFGCRALVVYGGFALFVGYILSSIAPNIEVVMLAQGVIAASGAACTNPPSLIILGRYFDKRRGFANGLALAAGSLGGMLTPIVFTKLMEEYSVRGALLIQAALLFNIVVAASLFRPTELTAKLYQYEQQKKKRKEQRELLKPHGIADKASNGSLLMKEVQNGSGYIGMKDNGPLVPKQIHSVEHNSTREVSNSRSSFLKRRMEHHHSTSTVSQFSSIHSIMSSSLADLQLASKTKDSGNKSVVKCSFLNTFLKIMDIRMLKNKLVALFTIVFCTGSIGACLGVIFVAPLARDQNLTKDEIAITTALVSGSEFVFRILLGIFADMNVIERYRIVQISLFGTGAVLLSSVMIASFWQFTVFSILYGLFSGPLLSMYAPVCVDFVGLEKFHRVVGILLFFQGMFLGGFGPTIGVMRDSFGSYIPAFQMMSSVTILAGCLLFFVPCLRKLESAPDIVIESE
ncbi:monocarboxylate transporter 9-like [Saccostrea echinata]|uniref:monocarboxylate transporter 9-like n=1 Tax=Saccostrea echinata TaxID=191078 RepID=UPI002A82CD1C|nr:monocarboxylate transporter 9-like [Saccostrea echinata]